LLPAANRAAADYQGALHLMRPKHPGLIPRVLKVSSIESKGIAEAWSEMDAIHAALRAGDRLTRLRGEQARRWFWSEVQTVLSEAILADENLAAHANALENEVASGGALPYTAARALIHSFRT
jgi:LAO/AO transport system kinase